MVFLIFNVLKTLLGNYSVEQSYVSKYVIIGVLKLTKYTHFTRLAYMLLIGRRVTVVKR